ncbi:mitochondrial escape protein 2 [Marasmius crinis-equi]|uniref:Mitochondrial escape protein 2 n=1 Tax=Marasmius crinis-equi TaxID=585013 RepID=A0ABR3FR08_9AGAR
MLSRARLVARLVARNARSLSTQAQDANTRNGAVYVDSILPIQLGRFDFRPYLGLFREDRLINTIRSRFSTINLHNLEIENVEAHRKDGGVFVKFRYSSSDPQTAVKEIEEEFRKRARENGGIPSWWGKHVDRVWLVRGRPWLEDLWRFPSNLVKVSFDGPDLHEEALYNLFRPFGRIGRISEPTPVPAGTLRSATIAFENINSSTAARNVLHGHEYPTTSSASTKLHCVYVAPIQAHAIRDWMTKHPKIVLPIVVFLLGTLTYTIFDPIRAFMVEGKMLDRFSLQEYKLYKWLKSNTLDRLYTSHTTDSSSSYDGTWKERKDAEAALDAYLTDLPSTVAFVHGPQGSGKTQMVQTSVKNSGRRSMVIDCRNLQRATSDKQLVDALASQMGYWPVFSFLSSMNNLIDLASVGLIGQKAGFSSSIEEQLQQILDTVAKALKEVHHSEVKAQSKQREKDAKSGQFVSEQAEENNVDPNAEKPNGHAEKARKQRSYEEILAVKSLPIVVIRNFAIKGGLNREQVMDVLAKWAAKLAESQIAHVVVISDNRENSKRLAKALPSKPLNSIPVYDADPATALEYVQKKLKDADVNVKLSNEEVSYIERLGGRSSDLESLIHKVLNKQGVKEAIEEIITRGVAEQRKAAFGDDSEDAKSLPWTREQAWFVLKKLASKTEVPYHEVLLNFPFKGDEAPLRSMEQAELISIGTHNGRPSVIRPGRPVYRWVFERLVDDPIFQAIQEIAYNDALIASASSTIQSCEDELLKLREIGWNPSDLLWTNPAAKRAEYLLTKMKDSGKTLNTLEKKNAELKKTLSKET